MKKLKYIPPVLIAIACLAFNKRKQSHKPTRLVRKFCDFWLSGALWLSNRKSGGAIQPASHSRPPTLLRISICLETAAACVNVNGAFTLGAITGTQLPGFTSAKYSKGGAGNEDGFGSFNFTINSMGGYTTASKSITFTLTKTGGHLGQ